MTINENVRGPKWVVFLTALSFALMGGGALYIFFSNLARLLIDLISLPESIEFNKGSFYLLGVGLGLMIMVLGISYINFFNKTMSASANRRVGKIIIACLVLVFVLPQITHFIVVDYMNDHGYHLCEEKSYRWLHVRTMAYSKKLPCVEE